MTTMLGTASFMDRQNGLMTSSGVAWFGLGAVVGWPFSAALIMPLLFDEVVEAWSQGITGSIVRVLKGSGWVVLMSVRTRVTTDLNFFDADFGKHRSLILP